MGRTKGIGHEQNVCVDSRQRLDDEGFPLMNLHTRQSRRQFIKRTLATTGTLWLTTASGQLEIHDRRQIDSDALNLTSTVFGVGHFVFYDLGFFSSLGVPTRQ